MAPMRRCLATLLSPLLLAALPAAALAYFTATGTGTAAAGITTLSVPGSPAATSGSTVSVTWTASSIGGSVAATSYTVERYTSGGSDLGAASCSPVPASSGSPNALGSFTCTDSPAAGSYEYRITAHYDSSWTAATGYTNAATVSNGTSLSASAPATATTGTAIPASQLSATLSGATSTAGGTITFKVFGPQATAPTSCTTGGSNVGSAVTVSGNATYHPSAAYTPATAGTYWWYASYSGDASNTASASSCGTGMTSTSVTNATSATSLSAAAPATGTTGTAIPASQLSATLSGATSTAGGTITFKVFGPQATAPTSCTTGGSNVGSAVTVSGNATYHPSAAYTPATAGTYWWYASYSGDASNTASASSCGTGMTSTFVWQTISAASATDTTANTSTTSSSFTVQPSTTYLLLVFRHSAAGDGVTSIASTGLAPALSTASFTSVVSQPFNSSDYQWAYYVTTTAGASGTGTLKVSFTKKLAAGQITILDLVQVQGNSLTTPVLTGNEGHTTGSSSTASANLPSAPASGDAALVFLGTSAGAGTSAPAGTPAMTSLFYSQQSAGSAGFYGAVPAVQSESLALGSSQNWGTISLELNHG